jgi:hypothetical protein
MLCHAGRIARRHTMAQRPAIVAGLANRPLANEVDFCKDACIAGEIGRYSRQISHALIFDSKKSLRILDIFHAKTLGSKV